MNPPMQTQPSTLKAHFKPFPPSHTRFSLSSFNTKPKPSVAPRRSMAARSSLAGIEVPIIGSDAIKWFNVSVPSTSSPPSSHPLAPPTEDASSCCIIGDPPTYFIWRINKSCPNVLEIVEFCSFAEFPRVGLRIEFASALSPYAYICKSEVSSASGNPYMLYTLTVAGVAYLIRLTNITNYGVCSVLPPNEVVELNVTSYCDYGAITAIAATTGCLVIGGQDGSVGCFRLGMLDSTAPGFLHELRDDSNFGRLWSLMSRRTVASVKDLVCLEIHGRKLLFVLHLDGVLRVWDLLSCSKLLSYSMNTSTSEGARFARLWAGVTTNDANIVPLAVLHKPNSEVDGEMISLYNLHLNLGGKTSFSIEPSTMNFSIEESAIIDVKISSNKMWILKEDGLVLHNVFGPSEDGEFEQCFGLQELYIAEQLFQSSEHAADDLFWLAHSLYSSAKEQIASSVTSIFLRMLFLPDVYHNSVLRATLQDHNKHFTDSEFHSLTADAMKKEIISVIEHEGVSRSPLSLVYCWRNFCSHYVDNWCNKNGPCGLLLDSSTGAIGLIRKSSVSLLRRLEDIELLAFGCFDELGEIASSRINLSSNLEREVLFEVLRCTTSLSHQIGKSAPALFYQSFFSQSSTSPEEVVGSFLKVLETRCTSSTAAALHVSELGVDIAWDKGVGDHKILRKFSTDIFLSLHGLHRKAVTWDKVVDVILKYLNFLVPQKIENKSDYKAVLDIRTGITVQVTSQVAKVMFESALDMLLLLSYMMKLGGQINMLPEDVSRVQLELFPMIQEVITEWHIIHYFGTTPCESPTMEDFSSQLSLLQIDSSANRRSWNDKLGKCDFTLAFILLLDHQNSFEGAVSRHLPNPSSLIAPVHNFTSWIVWGRSEDESSSFSTRSTTLALILLKHGQFDAVEHLLTLVNQNLLKEKISSTIQGVNNDWCTLVHLLGCCLLAQAHRQAPRTSTEKKVNEAISCFFRAASLHEASKSLQNLSCETGLPHIGFSDQASPGAWKLHYYQWAMQMFEQYNMSAGACHFALAALEQVDEVLGLRDTYSGADFLNESPITAKGRLWANVFKFTLDLNYYHDAYCAIISNPDEESKYICLRRFIIVLYERGAIKILCDGQLPFIGLAEKVEQELAWKAERSDVSIKPNPYKLLYAFEMHQHNWRKAASYMYLHSAQLKNEAALKDSQFRSLILQERLNSLSATINALHLVRPSSAWFTPLPEGKSIQNPSKKARITIPEQEADDNSTSQKLDSCMDIEKLENEFVLTSAEYLLSLANVRWTFNGIEKPPPNLVEFLVHSNLHDMVFTVILKFFKGSALKRELERVFIAMSLKCCPSRENSKKHVLLLTSSTDEVFHDSVDIVHHTKGNDQWEALEQYIEKYKCFHPRLPVIVAETLLCADQLIELPLWLVQMFKGTLNGRWGMAGSESSPASLFQLYVDYGRYPEATNLLLHYIESVASLRPADVIRRKKTCAVWFPYTTIERLWCKLGDVIDSGHMVDQCEKLRSVLHTALLKHFKQLNVDSDDVMSSTTS